MRKYTVRSLNEEISLVLGNRYNSVLVEGEIGQISVPASGHCYLTLRDRDSVLAGVVWRNTWRQVRFRPKAGDRVLCRGRISVYLQRGVYQIYIDQMLPAGEGSLARQIEQRKQRLMAEGLLDPRRKRQLPPFPKVVGVATSLTGAALQDFLKVSGSRFPATRILVAGCTVQGEEAPASVIRAVELLLEDGRSEVVIVTRGGGSKEDLLPFQDEHLARFLAHCPVPVLSAVGHQIDTTLCDLVADVVAPTPSAAAVQVLPDGPAWAQRIDDASAALHREMTRHVLSLRNRVEQNAARLRHPGERVKQNAQRMRDLEQRLFHAMDTNLTRARQTTTQHTQDLQLGVQHFLRDRQHRLQRLDGQLTALSPLSVLGRGYAIVRGPDGVITSSDQVRPGMPLTIRVTDGTVTAKAT